MRNKSLNAAGGTGEGGGRRSPPASEARQGWNSDSAQLVDPPAGGSLERALTGKSL